MTRNGTALRVVLLAVARARGARVVSANARAARTAGLRGRMCRARCAIAML
jgi:hypothetical protein